MKNKFIKLFAGIRLVTMLGSLLSLVTPPSFAATGTSQTTSSKKVRFKVFSLDKNNSLLRKELNKGDSK